MAATINYSQMNLILDSCEGIASIILPAFGQRIDDDPILNWGENGVALRQKEFEVAFLTDIDDLEATNALGPSIYQLRGSSKPETVVANYFSDLFSRLGQITQGMAVASNVITLDQWLAYYNYGGGGANLAIQSPYVRYIMECLGLSASAGNFGFPVYSGGNHVGSQTGGVFTPGTKVVDTTKYVGGSPRLKLYTYSSNNGAVEVTGECWDPATQSILTGKTWVTTGGTFTAALEERSLIPGGATPAPANALLTKATAMSGVNAGNRMDVRIYAPAGRGFTEWVV